MLHFQEKKLNYFVKTVIAVVTTIVAIPYPTDIKNRGVIRSLPF